MLYSAPVLRTGENGSSGLGRRFAALAISLAAAVSVYLVIANPFVSATSGGDPYSAPAVNDTNPAANVVETTITSEEATVDIGNGVQANAQTYNGQIPGPTFELNVGDTVIVHYHNHLAHDSGIHWHGIELANGEDGTPFTQDMIHPGGSFIYKFTAPRPGLFWYHPHHHSSTNQVYKGLYGLIVVRDPSEAALQASGTLPSAAQTRQIVLSDTTVCRSLGDNPGTDTGSRHAYDDNEDDTPAVTAPWSGSAVANSLPTQPPPAPKNLCEGPNVNGGGVENPYPADENGDPRGPFAAGDIPNTQTKLHAGRTNEGTIVLTNGKNVGARAGGPKDQGYVPGPLAGGASTLNVQPGQGLRLQILNAATTRYMRLQLTDPNGETVPLFRVGGESGLLNDAVEEGGIKGSWDTKYKLGEILLPPGTRADVVAAIPSAPVAGVLTLWTEDYERTGGGYTDIPTVPVMHLNLSGGPVNPAYKIESGTKLRSATGNTLSFLGAPTGNLLNPAGFSPPKKGMKEQNIKLTSNGQKDLGIDGTFGTHDVAGSYMAAPHLGSTRYAKEGDILELSTENDTGGSHHPFHLHGFSMQPIKLDGEPYGPGGNDYTWEYPEFRDNIDIPPHYRLIFRVRLDPRALADGATPGGALGRWLFHCHIFFHATNGMLSELVITDPSGNERPDVNVDDAEPSVNPGSTATVTGTYRDPDGDPVSLSASVGSVADNGGGKYTWTYPTSSTETSQLVYITGTDSHGLKGQIPFYLQVGPNQAQPPVLKKLKVTPKAFAAAKGITKLKRASTSKKGKKKKKRGAKIRFGLSKPAKVQFTLKRVKPKRPKVKAPKFSRQIKKAGNSAVRFTGRFKKGKKKKKPLPPGKYRLTAQATDSGGLKSKRLTTTFKILR